MGLRRVIDVYSRMIVGYQLATHLRTDLALAALEMTIWCRHQQTADLSGLVHHSDRRVQYMAKPACCGHPATLIRTGVCRGSHSSVIAGCPISPPVRQVWRAVVAKPAPEWVRSRPAGFR